MRLGEQTSWVVNFTVQGCSSWTAQPEKLNKCMSMKYFLIILTSCSLALSLPLSCRERSPDAAEGTNLIPTDTALAGFINQIRAVDNHAHPNTIDPDDPGADALPLDGLGPIELPVRLRAESPDWQQSVKAVYGFDITQLSDSLLKNLIGREADVKSMQGSHFPSWALDQAGIEVMLANRLFMDSSLPSSRFRWVAYVDALLFPLSTQQQASVTPDREKLFPLEDRHLRDFLSAVKLQELPKTLDQYLKQVVTATLESQKRGGCLALKFEVAYLRSLRFEKTTMAAASQVYARYVHGGIPSHEAYKVLQDFLFRYIGREAGRLGMAIHIHAFPAFGNYYVAADSDPILLESVFNDPDLRHTQFVLIHGGGSFFQHTSAMLWKPNVYADISMLTRLWPPDQLAVVLREWLTQFPEKVLFGSDAVYIGPGLGWELGAWISSFNARRALTQALSVMISGHEINLARAEEIATMVMRTNALRLYKLAMP
jgi:hypothetical protein